MNNKIKQTIQEYLKSIYTGDFDKVISHLDKQETKKYVEEFISFAEKMDVFGETEEFLEKVGIKDLSKLKTLSTNEFMTRILTLTKREIGAEELNKMIEGIEITEINVDKDIAIVSYQIPTYYFGEEEKVPSKMKMTKQLDDWKINFSSGLDRILSSFQQEIDLYHERKFKDQLDELNHNFNDLGKVTLVGYKNMNGDIVFEPRFKDGGDFSEGLAYVKVMSKYGFIDKTGEIVIKPMFNDTKNFSEDLAGVQLPKTNKWGFINTNGKLLIEPSFDEVSEFNEGFCAIRIDQKWGYINTEGKIVIPCKFEQANNFWDGEAEVIRLDEDGDFEHIYINKQGEIVDYEE